MPSTRTPGFTRWLQSQPQRSVGMLAVLLGLVLCGLVAGNLQRDYQQQLQAATARNDSLVRLLEEHVRQSMRRIELAMSQGARDVQAQYQANGRISPATGTHLRNFLPADGLLDAFVVLNNQGQVVASTLAENLGEMPSLHDRDFYQALQQQGAKGLFIGQAIKSRITGQWIIPFALRIEGGANGILVGAVNPEYFQNLYHSIDLGERGFVTMLTTQGWVIARAPFSSEIAQKNWRDAALFRDGVAHAAAGVLQGKSESTQVDVVYSYRALQDYPLVVTLGVPRDAVLQAWRERALYQVIGLLLVLLLLGGAMALLLAQLRRRMRELTARKQAESEVQRSAALLRSAMDAVDEAFVLFDTDDRMVYCNAKYAALYPAMQDVVVPGARFEDMIRIGAERGLYRESAGRVEEWVAERLRAHREGVETRIQERDDGRVMRVIDRRTPEGNIVGIRVDITEMVRATEEAQEASRYKSQFLANMSHELRTPMNAILGLLTLLQQTDLKPNQRDYASKTEGAAQSLLRLLNDILDFSKVEAGKMELDLQPVQLDRLLRDLAVILSTTLEGKSIEVLFDIAPDVPQRILTDAMRLQQVLVNLGGNAIKFTQRGQVVIRLRRLSEALEFAIEDSGIGIAPEHQERIFSGFSQAEASTTRRFGGTGLGLAISRRLVTLMGGTLSVHSELGQGSTFSFALPLQLPAGATQATATQSAMPPQRVLVVDDNPQARSILSGMTRSWSWPTQIAHSGAEALALARQHAFDVVLLDWQMPGMDGWETARQIRELAQQPRPRIIMLSANGQDRLERRTHEEQAWIDGFVFKPVTPISLQEAALGLGHDAESAPLAQRSSERRLAGMRILVVEDNLINQQVAEELLTVDGALVSLAANGQLGVDAVAASSPAFDAVLMDIQMPVLDGYGATRKIREELGESSLPIIAMTANAMASDAQACLEAGMNAHVGKPFDMNHLVGVLLQVTGYIPPQDGMPAQGTLWNTPIRGHTAPMFSSPYLDLAPALERMSGLTALYVDIAQEFLQSLETVEADFRQAAQSADARTLAAQMHTLKGTSATLGAQTLSDYAAGLDKRFKEAAPGLVPLDALPGLLALIAHTREAVLQAVARLKEEGLR